MRIRLSRAHPLWMGLLWMWPRICESVGNLQTGERGTHRKNTRFWCFSPGRVCGSRAWEKIYWGSEMWLNCRMSNQGCQLGVQVFRLDLQAFQFCHGKYNMAIRVFPLAIGYVIREERVKPGNSTTVSPSTTAASTDPTGGTFNWFFETKIKGRKNWTNWRKHTFRWTENVPLSPGHALEHKGSGMPSRARATDYFDCHDNMIKIIMITIEAVHRRGLQERHLLLRRVERGEGCCRDVGGQAGKRHHRNSHQQVMELYDWWESKDPWTLRIWIKMPTEEFNVD